MNSKQQLVLVTLGLLFATPSMGLGIRAHTLKRSLNMAQLSSQNVDVDVNNQDLPPPSHSSHDEIPKSDNNPTDIPAPSHEENLAYDTNPTDIPEPTHYNMRIEFDTNTLEYPEPSHAFLIKADTTDG